MKGRVCHGFGSGPQDNPDCSAASKVKVQLDGCPARIHGTKAIYTCVKTIKNPVKCG